MEISEACKQLMKDMNDPNSKASLRIKKLNDEIEMSLQTIDLLKDYLQTLSIEEFDLFATVERNKRYNDPTYSYYSFVSAASDLGRLVTEEEFDSLNDDFSSCAYFYKGYAFGTAMGSPWFLKFDANIQLDLF